MKAVLLAGLCGAVLCAGCSSKSESSGAASGEFTVFPEEIFTGTDGQHTYLAPIIAHNNKAPVTWTIADTTVASIKPEGAGNEHLMITALKAGDTTITATSGDETFEAPLHVVAYTAAQYAEGEKRYTMTLNDDNPACKECHAPGKGPDHTATELDADPDSQIQNTFLTGVDPEDRPIQDNSEFSYLLKGKTHMWTVTETEKIGLCAYLRSLPPMGYPEFDEPTTEKDN